MKFHFNEESKQIPSPISAYTLLFMMGLLGIFLPLILFIGTQFSSCDLMQNSISDYYYTNMGDVFVGVLVSIGLMFLCYNGYDDRDAISARIAGIAVIGVALFPTSNDGVCGFANHANFGDISTVHFTCAAIFFLTLAYMSYFLFTKSTSEPSKKQTLRNQIFRSCGIVIFCCILFLLLYFFITPLKEFLNYAKPVFVAETIALIAFGLSWIIKSKVYFLK